MEIFELLTLYDINSISIDNNDNELRQEIIEKASRLFGITKIMIYVRDLKGYKYFCHWGIKEKENLSRYFKLKKEEGFLYHFKENSEFIYMEKNKPFNPKDIKLLTVFAKRIEEVMQNKKYRDWLEHLTLHDHLTGVYNRIYFNKIVREGYSWEKYPISFLIVDINGLKLINESFGHSMGDEILQTCARLLEETVPGDHPVARLGGSEFGVILLNTGNREANEIAGEIVNAKIEHRSKKLTIPLTVSAGVSTLHDYDMTIEEAYKEAADNMNRDKIFSSTSSKKNIVDVLTTALSERDFVTGGHLERLDETAKKMGEFLNLDIIQMDNLRLLAKVHDIGKIGIPDSILYKPGKLNEEEWEIMKDHSKIGYRIASSSRLLSHVSKLILHHHEKWDGTGYVYGLKGEEIPIECRILSIIDAYDALTNDRPYRKAVSPSEALKEIERNAGTQFDPNLVEIFKKSLLALTSL